MEYVKIKGYDNLIRNPKTNSIINTNINEYNEYIARKTSEENDNQKIQNLEIELANIKENIEEIKTLLGRLVNES